MFVNSLRAETHESPVVVVVELRSQTVRGVRVRGRQLRSVSQAVELVLAVQQDRAIDIHDRAAIDARAHEPVQLRADKLSGHVEERIARVLRLAVDRGLVQQVYGRRAVRRWLDVVWRTRRIAFRYEIPGGRVVGP